MLKLLVLAVALLAVGSDCRSLSVDYPMTPDLDTISIYIKKVLENLKQEMPRGIPELGIPRLEPLEIPNIDIPRIREGIADVKLDMSSLRIAGLSSFTVEHAKGDMQNLGVDLGLRFERIRGQGRYNLDGKILFFPLYGNGNAYLQVDGLRIRVKGGVRIMNLKTVQLENLKADVSFSNIQLMLQGILGGGNLGDVVNQLLNALGKLVFDQTKHLFMPELVRIIQTAVNNELRKVDLQDIIGGIIPSGEDLQVVDASANNYVDRVLQQLRPEISRQADPLSIPDQRASFSKRVGLIRFRGSASMTNGNVRGLASLHRAGNCDIRTDGQGSGIRLIIGCALGVNNMRGSFRARAEFMKIGVSASISFDVPRVRVRFGVSSSVLEGSSPNLDEFRITEVSRVNVRISGLGPLDWIFNSVANVVVNAVRSQIVRAIEGPVRDELRKVLQQVEMPRLS